jgi:DNA mismatch endonuclease (patch repair protein)
MDVFTREKRSDVMSRIKSHGNRSTDRKLAAVLRGSAISGWKMQPGAIIGHPDFYFPVARIALFVDGCFWHACKKCFRMPMTNQPFWITKISTNVRRDKEVTRALKRKNIRVLRIWEHDLNGHSQNLEQLIKVLRVKTHVQATRGQR